MVNFIILGAGKGTRMKSILPKVLHKIASFSLIEIVISLTKGFNGSNTVVVTSEENNEIIKNYDVSTVIQKQRLGTGHAVKEALNLLQNNKRTFILYGDTPLIKSETLKKMEQEEADLVVLGFEGELEEKYGRLIAYDTNYVKKIVEFKDLAKKEKKITLFNSGVFLIKTDILLSLIPKIQNNNKSKEYYLTDIIELAFNNGYKSKFILCDKTEVIGVNTKQDLSNCELILQNRLRNFHMNNGVTLLNPASTFFSFDTKIESDVTIEPNVFFGENVVIDKFCHIKAFSYLEGCFLKEGVCVGPFARVRPHSTLGKFSKIGNFVEVKNSQLANDVKAGHLSYIGDAEIAENCNIGAGTVFCNYDGKAKNKTIVKNNAFIGSNSSLIAPLIIEENTTIGAGSVINSTVKKNSLALARSKQVNINNYNK